MNGLNPCEEERTFVARYIPACGKAPAAMRAWSVDVLRRWGAGAVSDDMETVISELTTNAVQAGALSMAVRLELLTAGRMVEVAVWDDAPGVPEPREPDFVAESGRGLYLVRALSASWGHDPADGGKTVWARLPVPSSRAAAAPPPP